MLKFNSIWEAILVLIILGIVTFEVFVHLIFGVYGTPFV